MKFFLSIFFPYFFFGEALCQNNLIPNSSFENHPAHREVYDNDGPDVGCEYYNITLSTINEFDDEKFNILKNNESFFSNSNQMKYDSLMKTIVGVGFLNYGSFFSFLFEKRITQRSSFRINIGENSLVNGPKSGISISLTPEFRLLNNNKFYLSVNSGILYSKSFNSKLKNIYSVNDSNLFFYGIGGPRLSYRNHFSFVSAINFNIKIKRFLLIETTLFYYLYNQYVNVSFNFYNKFKVEMGIVPSISLKYLIK